MGSADARDHAVILQQPYGADELPGFGSAIHVRVRGKGKALAKARGKLFVGPAAHHACQLQHGGRVGLARVFGQSIFVLRLFFVSPKGCGGVGRVSRVGSIGIAGQLARADGRHVGLPIGLPLLRQRHEFDRKHGRIGQVGRQGWGGQQLHGSFDAAGLGLLGLRLFVPCADTGLHPAVKAQQAGNVVGGATGQGGAAVALALGVAELDRGRPFARLVHIDLVGAVGVVFVVARCIVSIAPAVLERAAPGFAIVHAGLARAHPDLALPVAVAVAVPPVVVLLGEHGQAGEGLDVLGRHRGLQALVEGVPRAVLAHGLAHIVQHPAPGVFAGLPGAGVVAGLGGGRQHLPVARLALRVAAVQQRALGDRGGRVAPQLGGHALQPVAGRGH